MRQPNPLVVMGLTLCAALAGMAARGFLSPIDNFIYDLGVASRSPKVPGDMVILGIDEKFMEGRHAYLAPRDRLARLIRNVANGKPKAIAVDVWLDSRIDNGPNGVDAQLKSALAYAKSRQVPVILSDVPQGGADFATESENGQTAHGTVLPFFASQARTGSVLFTPDRDGVIRWHPLEKIYRPSLPAQMAALGSSTPPNLDHLQLERAPIAFSGPPGTIQHQSASDFLEPGLESLLQNQLVFIGATYPRSLDFQPTPYTQSGKKPMYGVELLAQSTNSLRGPAIKSWETTQAQFNTLFFALIGSSIVAYLALWGTARGASTTVAFLLAATIWAFYSARDGLAQFVFQPESAFLLALPLATAGGIAWRSVVEGRELRRVRDTFGAYVGAQVLESLNGKMPELGGETRPIAVLFCDIRGYSALAESMSNDPKALLDELNAHFAPLVAALQKRGAYVDNYVGDLVMALFGAPVSTGSYQGDVRAAVLAALDFVSIIEARNITRREKGLFPIEVGIGVHCGEAVVGNMGSTDAKDGGKIHYTAIGDVVNVASRIESATRGQNVALLVTREVVETCGEGGGMPAWDRIGEVNVKGRAAAVEIFKVASG